MSRAKTGRGTALTALLLAAAFLAGSATYLALKDSFTPEVEPNAASDPYYLIPTKPSAGPATLIEDETAAVDLPDPEPEEQIVAVQPEAAPVTATEEPDTGGDSLPVSASSDTPVKLLYVKPVEGPISKKFSAGELVYSETLGDYRTHAGTDIAAEQGAKVRAMADGVVSDMYSDELLGAVIEITHEDGTVTRYCNLLENHVSGIKVGVAVKMGDVISGVGQTALSEGAEEVHLHLEAIRGGSNIDPEILFQ